MVSPGERLERVVVLGDEVVSSRALSEAESWMVAALASDQLWAAVGRVAATTALGLAGVVAYLWMGDIRWLSPVLVAGGLLARARGHLPVLSRALALRKDRALRQLLVFESRRGRCERLAGSGLLWRRDGVDAPWRSELA